MQSITMFLLTVLCSQSRRRPVQESDWMKVLKGEGVEPGEKTDGEDDIERQQQATSSTWYLPAHSRFSTGSTVARIIPTLGSNRHLSNAVF